MVEFVDRFDDLFSRDIALQCFEHALIVGHEVQRGGNIGAFFFDVFACKVALNVLINAGDFDSFGSGNFSNVVVDAIVHGSSDHGANTFLVEQHDVCDLIGFFRRFLAAPKKRSHDDESHQQGQNVKLLRSLYVVHGLHGECIARQSGDGPGHAFLFTSLVAMIGVTRGRSVVRWGTKMTWAQWGFPCACCVRDARID